MAPPHPIGAQITIVNDDPRRRVLTDLPQVLLADDLVRRSAEECLEPRQRGGPVAHRHDAVQIHRGRSSS
jgi:hypothetical protein